MNEVTGKLSGKKYSVEEAIRIISPWQVAFYWSKGVEPLDIYQSVDHRDGKPILVGVFKRSETKRVYDEWMEEVKKQRELRERDYGK